MPAGTHDILLEQGADWALKVELRDEAGEPLDLTGWSARAQIRSANGLDLIADLSGTQGGASSGIAFEEIEGTPARIVLSRSAAQTAAMDFAEGVWSLETTDTSGKLERRLQGKATLSRRVIREE